MRWILTTTSIASSLSFHLAHLKRAALVTAARKGRSLRYAADFAAMRGLADFLTDNGCAGVASPPADEKAGDAMRALLERQQ